MWADPDVNGIRHHHLFGAVDAGFQCMSPAAQVHSVLNFLKQRGNFGFWELWLALNRMASLAIIRPVPGHRVLHMLRPLE